VQFYLSLRPSRVVLILLFLLAGCARPASDIPTPGSEGGGDSYFPHLGNGGYDSLHYTIDLAVDAETNRLAGTTTILAQATQPLSAFNLDFLGLEIAAIQVNGEAANFQRVGSELTVTPVAAIARGAEFTVTVRYSGIPQPVEDPSVPFAQGWMQIGESIVVFSEPSGAMNWYPVNNHPTDKATYTFRITVAKPLVVAANGLLQQQVDNGTTTTYIWEARNPMASYLATVAIGTFVVESEVTTNGLPLRNYFPPNLDQKVSAPFDRTAEMIDYFSSILGPYPFEAYGVVVIDGVLDGYLETQTLSLFDKDPVEEFVVVHELAHQWFGNSISLHRWQDIWLNEGFATYSQALWTEHTQGTRARDEELRWMYREIERRQQPLADPSPEGMFDWSTYVRGALTLHALRLAVGDEDFFSILRAYYERFGNGTASTQDFIVLAEEVSGEELDDLFHAWLYATEIPPMPTNR